MRSVQVRLGQQRDVTFVDADVGARDLLHLACCRRRGIDEIKTFDRPLAAAFRGK